MQKLAAAFVALVLATGGGAASAQETSPAVQSPILTLDQDRLFAETLWGKRAVARIEAASTELAAENRRIEAELTEEEKALTERRASMEPEDFRLAADAFDARVTEIRKAQDTKARAIGRMHEAERQGFYAAAFPVIGEVVRSRGAVAVLDSRAILIASDAIDVTDEMIERIDAALGDGAGSGALPEQEETAPEPEENVSPGD